MGSLFFFYVRSKFYLSETENFRSLHVHDLAEVNAIDLGWNSFASYVTVGKCPFLKGFHNHFCASVCID